MRIILWIVLFLIIIGGGFYGYNTYFFTEPLETPVPEQTMETKPVTVTPISHATALLTWGETNIYTDPTGGADAFREKPAPSIILVTDIHGDHLSTSTLEAILGNATLIVPQAVKELLPTDMAAKARVLANGETITEQGISITGVPMYNLPDAENADRHVKGRGNGYVIEKDGFRVYVAGDTAGTSEMRALTNIDIAFIPMNLPFTMSVEEAADAVLAFRPKQVYPYHYRGQGGTLSDVTTFKSLVNTGNPAIDVVLAEWYPQQ